jgi:hypothetical protein
MSKFILQQKMLIVQKIFEKSLNGRLKIVPLSLDFFYLRPMFKLRERNALKETIFSRPYLSFKNLLYY